MVNIWHCLEQYGFRYPQIIVEIYYYGVGWSLLSQINKVDLCNDFWTMASDFTTLFAAMIKMYLDQGDKPWYQDYTFSSKANFEFS